MYQTKKQLMAKIASLEERVELAEQEAIGYKKLSALLDSANLPPCKSLACVNCEHIVFYKTLNGGVYILGCGKSIECPDFIQQKDALSEKEKAELQQQILEQGWS